MRLPRLLVYTWPGRAAVGAVVVAIVGGVVVAPRFTSAAPTTATRTVAVARGNVVQTVTVSGTVNAEQQKLSFRSQGRLSEVRVKVGDAVTAGQVLARLDDTDLKAAVKQAEASLLSAQAKYDATVAGASAEDLALAKNALETATQSYQTALTNAQKDVDSARQALEKAQTAWASAKSSYATLSAAVIQGIKDYEAAITALQTGSLGVRGALQDVLRAGDVTTAYNAMVSAESSLALAQTYARSLLDGALADYANAVAQVQTAINVLDIDLAQGRDTSEAQVIYSGGQRSLTDATAKLTTALDAVAGQVSSAQASANTAQSSMNTQTARADSSLEGIRGDLKTLLVRLSAEAALAATTKSRTGQVTSSLSGVGDAINGSLLSARQALAAAQDKQTTTVASQQVSLESSKVNYQRSTASPKASDIASAQAGLLQAQVALDKGRADLAGATLTSPAAGVVASVANGVGETPASPFIILALTTSLTLRGSVGESDVAKLKTGLVATVAVDAIGSATRLTGKVTAIDPVATIQQGVPVYGVDIVLDRPDPAIRSGMSGTATVIVASKQNVLTVPNSAIRTVAGRKVVQVMQNGVPTAVPVSLGISNGSVTEVVSGLEEGQLVALPTAGATTTTTGVQRGFGGGFGGARGGGAAPVIIQEGQGGH